MIVLKPITSTQVIKFIPREFITSLEYVFTDDITMEEIAPNLKITSKTGNYISLTLQITGLKEGRFYTFKAKIRETDEVIYRDKCFVTNQGIDQTQEQNYNINKDVYVTNDTYDNDYIVL